MRDLQRISCLAVVLIVVLRMSIGWQFLYEGLWKINTQETTAAWTAEGYLKNAQGPFRDHFRNLTGDPDDLGWLESPQVAGRWDDWQQRFIAHHGLTDVQQRRLDALVNGPKFFSRPLERLPEGLEIPPPLNQFVRYDAQVKRLMVDGRAHLLPAERDRLLGLVTVEENPADADRDKNEIAKAWQQRVRELHLLASRLSFKERLRVLLEIDPERAGLVLRQGDAVIENRMGDIELYRRMLARYNEKQVVAATAFERDHLDRQWKELQELRARLVGPVKALDTELKEEAAKLLTAEQFARGPLAAPPTTLAQIDWLTMWSLTIIGALLIAGFVTPAAAIAGAGLLMMFYLAMPPWPGVPEAPGPEHSLIVNKNLIEALALLAIAALPTGRWFGVDALFYGLWLRLGNRQPTGEPAAAPPSEPQPPAKTKRPDAPPVEQIQGT